MITTREAEEITKSLSGSSSKYAVEVEELNNCVITCKIPDIVYPNGEPFRFYLIKQNEHQYTITDLGDIYFTLESFLPYSLYKDFEASTIKYDHVTIQEIPIRVNELISIAEYLISVAKREITLTRADSYNLSSGTSSNSR